MPKIRSDISVELVCELYLKGLSKENISLQCGISTWSVTSRLSKGGVKVRTNRDRTGLKKEDQEDIASRYGKGDSIRSIRELYKISKELIWTIAKEHKIKRRPPGSPSASPSSCSVSPAEAEGVIP